MSPLAIVCTIAAASGYQALGKMIYVGLLVLLLVWLVLLPKRLIGHEHHAPPWWRNVRFWAIAITVVQILIYTQFG